MQNALVEEWIRSFGSPKEETDALGFWFSNFEVIFMNKQGEGTPGEMQLHKDRKLQNLVY